MLRHAGLAAPPPVARADQIRTRRRGTAVHAIAEAHAHGEAIPSGELDGYVDGVRQWFLDCQPVVLATERRLVSKRQRVTGRIDLGIWLDGRPVVVDYKTGSRAPVHGIQVAGYVDLANEHPDMRALSRVLPWVGAILYLPGNGRYRWVGPQDLDARNHYLWRSALALVQWRYDHKLLTETDPENPDTEGDTDADYATL